MSSRQELEDLIIKYGKRMGEKNYTPGYSGNISCRYQDGMLITTSGSSNGYLREEEIVYTDFSGKSFEEGKKPSSEKLLHIAFYKMRPDINFILHVHAPYLSTFASAGKSLELPVMAENVFYFGSIPLAEYALPSSIELVEKTSKYFDTRDAVLMANHGFIVGSSTMKDAYMKLELAESYAQVVLFTELLGGAKALSKEQADAILALRG